MHRLFKDNFTLKQYTAFTLASNWALHQHGVSAQTQHFHNLVRKNMKFGGDEDVFKKSNKSIIKEVRNYFSHYEHRPARCLTESEADVLNKIVGRLVVELNYRSQGTKTPNGIVQDGIVQDGVVQDGMAPFLDDPTELFHFTAKPILDHTQPEIALMFALFLSKGQAAFLSNKIFFGENSKTEHSDGTIADTPEVVIKKKLLKIMAQPDNIIIRNQPDSKADPWLDKKYEQGFAIWQLLVRNHERTANGEVPDYLKNGNYMMRQLIQFIELHHILPNFQFARVETQKNQENAAVTLEQVVTFTSDANLPLATRHNTIQAIGPDNVKGTFGLRTLIYIVLIFMDKQNKQNEVADFVTWWLKENANYTRSDKQISGQPLFERIASRLEYLMEKSAPDTNLNLHQQIRFICQRINHVWFCHHGKHLHRHEYEKLEQMVRYYRKSELHAWLEDEKLLDIGDIQLHRGGIKTLRKAIKAERIQQLYKDLRAGYWYWLQEQKDKLPKLDSDAQKVLAQSIKVRKNLLSSSPPDFPIGLPEKVLRQKFFFDEKKGYAESLTDILRSIFVPSGFEEPQGEPSSALKKRKHIHNYQRLLLAMAWYAVKELIDSENADEQPKNQSLDGLGNMEISIPCEVAKITMKFSKSWRRMAKLNKPFLVGLACQYCADEKSIPLLRADETKAGMSIESAKQNFETERYRFMQSLLQWEQNYCKAHPDIAESGDNKDKGYVEFCTLAKDAGLDSKIAIMRNDVFHDRVPEVRFSDCPAPIKENYVKIHESEEKKQKKQKQQGIKRGSKLNFNDKKS